MKQEHERELIFTDDFWSFYHSLQEKVRYKFDYVFGIVRTEKVLTTRFVKRLERTNLYEMRVSTGSNEYRTVLFAIDSDNIISATRILVLNAFLKKSTKDYKSQIHKAETLLKQYNL